MNDPRWQRLDAYLGRLLDAAPADRAPLADWLCGGDRSLRDELLHLLRITEDGHRYLDGLSARLRERMSETRALVESDA